MTELFDPANHGFVRLSDFHFPGDVACYEFHNHESVNGEPHFTRLNIYLSKDKNYVRVWFGFLDAIIAESRLQSVGKPPDFDVSANYEEILFTGWIDDDEQAGHILRAIRPENHIPQEVTADEKNRIACRPL